jgi:hypothetical protein
LAEAIDLERRALKLCPEGHPYYTLSCQNLAASLRLRYEHTGDQQLLAETIGFERRALDLCPQGHPEHASSCRNLAGSLHLRYQHIADQQLLEEAIELYNGSSLCGPQISQWRSFMGLADIYLERETTTYNMSKSIEHLIAGFASDIHDSIPNIVNWAIFTLNTLWQCKGLDQQLHVSFGQIYQRLVVLLPLLAHPVFGPQEQLRALKHCINVGPDAFIDAMLTEDRKSGIEMLELMQGLVWSQLLRHRSPQLDDVPVHLAKELKTSLGTLHRPMPFPASDHLPTTLIPRDIRYHSSIRVQALVREIRALPGLDRFMLGESFESLCAVALKYPAVVLVNARAHSYALILSAGPRSVVQDSNRCSLLRLDATAEEISNLTIPMNLTRYMRGSEGPHDVETHPGARNRHQLTLSGMDPSDEGYLGEDCQANT